MDEVEIWHLQAQVELGVVLRPPSSRVASLDGKTAGPSRRAVADRSRVALSVEWIAVEAQNFWTGAHDFCLFLLLPQRTL